MGLLTYSFGLLPCVRVRCGLYPHGLTDLLFLVCSHVREFVADCIHIGLLTYSFGLIPCVRVCCGLYPHGLTDLLFLVAPMCESSLRTVDCIHMGLTDLLFLVCSQV